MTTFLNWLAEGVQEELGRPAKLLRLLSDGPDLSVGLFGPAPSICASNVPAWHRLGKGNALEDRSRRGTLQGWKRFGGDFLGYQIHRPEYDQICIETIVRDWQCDISDVHGFANSRSDLSHFASTDELVERNRPTMIDEITPEKLARNLAHGEIRILHREETSDHFAYYAWDQRVWLMNDGGSHHVAAAKYIATRLGQRVPLKGLLRVHEINADAVASLRRDYEMFVMPEKTVFGNGFFDAMSSFKAPWLWHDMPAPFQATRAILLPRSERRSMRVAEEFRKCGATDFGKFLSDLVASQASKIDLRHDQYGRGVGPKAMRVKGQ